MVLYQWVKNIISNFVAGMEVINAIEKIDRYTYSAKNGYTGSSKLPTKDFLGSL